VTSLQSGIFRIRQSFVTTVCFVGGGNYNLLYSRRAAASFENGPRSSDVGFKRAYWVPIRDANDGLGGKVKDGIDLILTDHSLDRFLVANISANHTHSRKIAGTKEFILGYPVSDERYNKGALVKKLASEPATQ
jgi:hypothetical protein